MVRFLTEKCHYGRHISLANPLLDSTFLTLVGILLCLHILTFRLTLPCFNAADAIIRSPALANFPLKGIAIGNGWIDPREQYQGYVDFAYERGLIKKGSKVSYSISSCIAHSRR
jgi:hypothetical protein